ncbi:plasmid mobilization relaxosome protein MobC [Flavobacterium zepuense]|uniref:Plasmid mobilization relaxosome protein MobC n=1 Tax=Flavobacterium zepuense TaxID=2593302 RepID=A0A552UUK7_9FLAO|nr:plasmid mobilization relaxosome protein MobC [Flavobacterium zepuense]TRW21933.1 plasmid mobilization relaxosome protein MobC [Flavobacterium zepuense]
MKNENSNRTKRIIFRMSPEEYQKIERRSNASTCKNLSDYLRHCLFDKPIVTVYRDGTKDDYLAEMGKLRQELNAVGNNFNQVVKRLHTIDELPEFRNWLMVFEVEKRTLSNKIDSIKEHILKLSESWLR